MKNVNDNRQAPSAGFYVVCAGIALLCAIEAVFLVLEYKNLIEANMTVVDYVLSSIYVVVVAVLVFMLIMRRAAGVWGSFIFFPCYVLATAISALLDPEDFPKALYVAINGFLYGGLLWYLGRENTLHLFGMSDKVRAFSVISNGLVIAGVFFLVAAYKGAVIAATVSITLVYAIRHRPARTRLLK